MTNNLLLKYNQMVPRYTSYPTAPHFSPMTCDTAESWLHDVESNGKASIYLHIPYCREMCWYCGCHTSATRQYAPVASYVEMLESEIKLTAGKMAGKPEISHLHFGGGSPSMLEAHDFERVMTEILKNFSNTDKAELALEADPRGITPDRVKTYAQCGINRASFGIQDFTPEVQKAINRMQDFNTVESAVALFRAAGIDKINFDLMYGLPGQTTQNLLDTVDLSLKLKPQRIALFGYAHVPWMKKHMRLIRDEDLPDATLRLEQFDAAAQKLLSEGYIAIGLDHFVAPGDEMQSALESKTLARNFQGYTTDRAPSLLGFGVSAISRYPQGYLQNASNIVPWREALNRKQLPVARGVLLTQDDHLRAQVISELMCYFSADIGSILTQNGQPVDYFDSVIATMDDLINDGCVTVINRKITVNPQLRQIVRVVAARFDRYFSQNLKRHAQVA